MKNNKHIHDEDYYFGIKLMVPLLTILVCTICLCATTWAWYTASVSTGVNSIKAGIKITESSSTDCSNCTITGGNGVYTLTNSSRTDTAQYTFTFASGEAVNGYFAEINIEDVVNTSFLDLFVNRVFADEINGNGNYYYYFNHNQQNNELSITIQANTTKQLKISYIWANDVLEEGKHQYTGNIPDIVPIKNNSLVISEQILPSLVTINYLDTDKNLLPASVLGIETYGLRDNLEEEPAIIRFETEDTEFTVTAPEGYLLQKDSNFNEENDVPYRTYQVEPGEEIEIDVICVKIEEEPTISDISEEEIRENDEVSEVPDETEQSEVTYAYIVNCIDTDSYTVINSFSGESVLGEITIDIPLIDGYVADSNITVIKITENTDANVFTVQYKKLYSYEIHYVDENNNILESVINQTSSNQVEVPLKKFDDKELELIEGEKSDTTARILTINKELETNIFEIHYTTIVPPENIEPLQEE